MNYFQSYSILKSIFSLSEERVDIPGTEYSIYNQKFSSTAVIKESDFALLKPAKKLFNALLKYYLKDNQYSSNYIFNSLDESDENISENLSFRYPVIKKTTVEKASAYIILFHGLNERYWEKYLPWAFSLASQTGKAVILFPLAFHMNRAPLIWSNPRIMNEVSKERKKLLPDVAGSSFANSALSTRLQFSPGRFLISGIQTFRDVVNLVDYIKSGNHPLISHSASADFFGYSIGAFLSEILLMSNPKNYFSDTRAFLFCGGQTLDQMQPVSKAIIDSEAALTLKNYYVDNSDKEFFRDDMLTDILNNYDNEGNNFISMLSNNRLLSFRMDKLEKLKNRLLAFALVKDDVMSPIGLKKTFGKLSSKCLRTSDYPYNYPHENPFPLNEKIKDAVDLSFNNTFMFAAEFLK